MPADIPIINIKINTPIPKDKEVEDIINSSGFSFIESDGHTISIARFQKFERKIFAKLLKKLSKTYGIKTLKIEKKSIQSLNTFLNDKTVFTGSGVRSFIKKIDDNAVRKVFAIPSSEYEKDNITLRNNLRNEIPEIIPVINNGDNYIDMPCIDNILKWNPLSLLLYPLDKFDIIFDFTKRLFENGYCLYDWNYNGFLFNENGDVNVCDFEYLYKHDGTQEISPDFTGIGYPEHLPPAALCTFDGVWKPVLGLSYHEYTTCPRYMLHVIRICRFILCITPRKILKRCNKSIQNIKYFFLYQLKDNEKYIQIQKRF